jgi:hypothetical protein
MSPEQAKIKIPASLDKYKEIIFATGSARKIEAASKRYNREFKSVDPEKVIKTPEIDYRDPDFVSWLKAMIILDRWDGKPEEEIAVLAVDVDVKINGQTWKKPSRDLIVDPETPEDKEFNRKIIQTYKEKAVNELCDPNGFTVDWIISTTLASSDLEINNVGRTQIAGNFNPLNRDKVEIALNDERAVSQATVVPLIEMIQEDPQGLVKSLKSVEIIDGKKTEEDVDPQLVGQLVASTLPTQEMWDELARPLTIPETSVHEYNVLSFPLRKNSLKRTAA